MDKITIENKGSHLFIGKTLCKGGMKTPVQINDFEEFCSTPGGASLVDSTIFVVDDAFNKKSDAIKAAAKQQALLEAKQELEPMISKKIHDKLEKKYSGIIEDLNSRISELEEENAALKKSESDAILPAENLEEDVFKFDPERHHIEHRGGGNWFVMDQEEKVFGPLSEEDKEEYEKLLAD